MTAQGPLGNKQVRVEDWVTLTPTGDVGTSAANTVQFTASAVDESYFILSQPQPLPQESQRPVLRWHVWYDVSGNAADPLPRESNQPGIRVVAASGTVVNDLADATASTIAVYFAAHPPAFVRASVTTDTVTIINAAVGPARVQDGVGSRIGVAASTSWTFASSIPGVHPETVSFTIASTIEADGSLGASIQQLVPQITDVLIASTYNVANDPEVISVRVPFGTNMTDADAPVAQETRVEMPDGDELVSGDADSQYFQLFASGTDYYVWFQAGISVDPLASGTGIEVSVSTISTSAEIATLTVAAIDAELQFSASVAVGDDSHVLILSASTGSVFTAVDVDASVTIAVVTAGSAGTAADFWQLYASGQDYYVWHGAGVAVDPALVPGTTVSGIGIQVGVSTVDNSAAVAAATASAIDAIGDFSATASAEEVLITLGDVGDVTDPVDITASVAIDVAAAGGPDFNIDKSNRFIDPDFDSSGT
jgi:hypothetical protein